MHRPIWRESLSQRERERLILLNATSVCKHITRTFWEPFYGLRCQCWIQSSGWTSIPLSASLLFAGHGHLETRWFTIPKTYWDNTWKYVDIIPMREEICWFSGWLSPCVGYHPKFGSSRCHPCHHGCISGNCAAPGEGLERCWDSGRFWSIFVHLNPPGFLPTFPALGCCKVTEDFYETTRCYEDGRWCHGSRLWFSCVGRMLAASSSCHSHRPGFVGCRVESRITLHQPLGRLMNKCY